MAAKKSFTLTDITKQATLPEVVVPICVAGELIAEHSRLDAKLEEAETEQIASRKLGDAEASEVERLRGRIRKLEADIKAQTHDFVFRALKKNAWRDLMEEHGPRKGKERQERWNPQTFPPAAVQASCLSPEGMDDDEAFRAFWEDAINDGQRDELFRGALKANEGTLSVPFSVSASVRAPNSGQS
jgi:hypothetical protein